MKLFVSKECQVCQALEKRIDFSTVPDLAVFWLPQPGYPLDSGQTLALSEADFYDVSDIPVLVIGEPGLSKKVLDVFEILEELQSAKGEQGEQNSTRQT